MISEMDQWNAAFYTARGLTAALEEFAKITSQCGISMKEFQEICGFVLSTYDTLKMNDFLKLRYSEVSTPKQFHLMKHCKKARVRKKWENAFIRRIYRKKQNGGGL